MAISFKHRYKSDTLIGTGTIKFRPYTVATPLPQLATPQNVTADGTVVSWDEVENATSYEVLADGASIGTVENVTQDALAGTWVFNDTLDFSSLGLNQNESKSWSVNFTSLAEYLNAPNTIKIEYGMVDADEAGNEYLGYSLIYVYTPTSGIAEPYTVYISNSSIGFLGWNASEQTTKNKTINITSKLSEVTNGEQLLTWLQANATKQ